MNRSSGKLQGVYSCTNNFRRTWYIYRKKKVKQNKETILNVKVRELVVSAQKWKSLHKYINVIVSIIIKVKYAIL